MGNSLCKDPGARRSVVSSGNERELVTVLGKLLVTEHTFRLIVIILVAPQTPQLGKWDGIQGNCAGWSRDYRGPSSEDFITESPSRVASYLIWVHIQDILI